MSASVMRTSKKSIDIARERAIKAGIKADTTKDGVEGTPKRVYCAAAFACSPGIRWCRSRSAVFASTGGEKKYPCPSSHPSVWR